MLTKFKALSSNLSSGKRLITKNYPTFNKMNLPPMKMPSMMMMQPSSYRCYSAAAIPAAVTEMENVFGSSTH